VVDQNDLERFAKALEEPDGSKHGLRDHGLAPVNRDDDAVGRSVHLLSRHGWSLRDVGAGSRAHAPTFHPNAPAATIRSCSSIRSSRFRAHSDAPARIASRRPASSSSRVRAMVQLAVSLSTSRPFLPSSIADLYGPTALYTAGRPP